MSRPSLDVREEEDAPFLDTDDQPRASGSSHPFTRSRWQINSPKRIVLFVAFAHFAIVFSGTLMMMPMFRLIEDALCHAHFKDDSAGMIDEMKCKADEVQANLATLLGWMGVTYSIITLVVAYPYGMLSDSIGRKPTALISYAGMAVPLMLLPFVMKSDILRRHPYILLTGSFFNILGGGATTLMATLYAIASDVSSEKDKASSFIYLTIGATIGGLLGPLMAGLIMTKYGPWLPIYIVILTTPIVFGILLLIPETLTINVSKQQTASSRPLVAVKEHLQHGLRDLFRSLQMMKDINILLILVTFFFHNARTTAYTSTLTQYVSKHFGWTIAETSLLLSPLGLVNLIVLASLPKISELLMSRFGFATFGKDILLTRIAVGILAVGFFLEGLSPSIVPFLISLFVSALGQAESPLARATVSHYVDPAYTSRLYALVGMTEVLGAFSGGPVLAWCFNRGLEWKGFWRGLPWFYVGVLCSICFVALMAAKPPKRSPGDEDDGNRSHPEGHVHLH